MSTPARTPQHKLWATVPAFILLAGLMSASCAAKQDTDTQIQRQAVQDFSCLPDRWAEPPANVGQTPPDKAPSVRDVDPFRQKNSNSQD